MSEIQDTQQPRTIESILAAASLERKAYRLTISRSEVTDYLYSRYELKVATCGYLVANEEQVRHWCERVAIWLTEECKPWLMLSGVIGSGKSTMLWAIEKTVRDLGKQTAICSVSALDLPSYATAEDRYFYDKRIVHGTEYGTWLFIDDIGAEPTEVKSYGNSLLPFVEIVNKRYVSRTPVLFTTNYNIDDIRKVYGERVADRIKEMANTINFKNPSYRK